MAIGKTGAVVTETRQGWFSDPFGRHEHRYFSQGAPTALVRDGGQETQDAPPAGDPAVTWVQAAVPRSPSTPRSQTDTAWGKQNRLRPLWLWLGLAFAGLVLLALGMSGPGQVQPAPSPMRQSAIAEARSTATAADITPGLCDGRLGNDNSPDVVADDSDNGRVVTVYEGQLVAINFGDGASMSPPGGTLQTDSGTDFFALHHADGSESVIELSIVHQPPPPGITASEVALDVCGALALILGLVGLIWVWHDNKRRRVRASSIRSR
jgi:hypothetical protein